VSYEIRKPLTSTRESSADHATSADRATAEAKEADKRRDNTLGRIRTALLRDRLSVLSLSDENTGADPYNSGVHRALASTHVWRKRSP
jgi:hypothetical protein